MLSSDMTSSARRWRLPAFADGRPRTLLDPLRPAMLLMLPFELTVGLSLGRLTFTNVELVLLLVLGLWVATLIHARRLPRMPWSLAVPAAGFVLVLMLSAALADAHR